MAVVIAPLACQKKGEALPAFRHADHLALGAACKDCHASGGAAPAVDACRTCHSEATEHVTPQQVEALLASLDTASGAYGLRFDHARHEGLECAECHKTAGAGIGNSSMDFCMTMCHGEGKDAALSCEKCHATLDAAGRPLDHAAGWRVRHGATAYVSAASCRECHRENECFECHRTSPPANHNQSWRLRAHGVTAQADRERCAACHRQEFCTRCHLGTRPINHAAPWNTRSVFRHCQNCHLPASNTGCVTCHVTGATHASAPAWRTDMTHVAGADCRVCHRGPGQRLEHPDNGDNCETCHAK